MPAVAGNSLLNLVTALVSGLGSGQAFTQTTDGLAANTVTCSRMIDTEAPTEKYGGYYLYNTADAGAGSLLGQQQRVTRGGFAGATGIFTTAQNFTGNSQNLSSWLLCGVMPVLDADGLTGIRTCINRALRKLWIRYRYPFVAVEGQISYDLGALWWAKRNRFIRLLDPDTGGLGRTMMASQSWDVIQNAETWTLELSSAYPVGQTFWLVCEMPANARLYLSAAWAMQSSPVAGLILGADACLGSFQDVYECARYECMQQLTKQAGGARQAYWQNEIDKPGGQRQIVTQIKGYTLADDGESLGEGPTNSPGGWGSVVGDHGFWSR